MALYDKEHQLQRTLGIVRQMADGRCLPLSTGHKIGMAEDLSIGFVITENNEDSISTFTVFDLKQLNELLNEEEIWFTI